MTEAEYLDRAAMERDWFGGEYYTSVYDNVTKRYVAFFAIMRLLLPFLD